MEHCYSRAITRSQVFFRHLEIVTNKKLRTLHGGSWKYSNIRERNCSRIQLQSLFSELLCKCSRSIFSLSREILKKIPYLSEHSSCFRSKGFLNACHSSRILRISRHPWIFIRVKELIRNLHTSQVPPLRSYLFKIYFSFSLPTFFDVRQKIKKKKERRRWRRKETLVPFPSPLSGYF